MKISENCQKELETAARWADGRLSPMAHHRHRAALKRRGLIDSHSIITDAGRDFIEARITQRACRDRRDRRDCRYCGPDRPEGMILCNHPLWNHVDEDLRVFAPASAPKCDFYAAKRQRAEPDPNQTGPVTAEMIREMLAHVPNAVGDMPARWQWMAGYLNETLRDPGMICPCCNITRSGALI